MILLPLHRAVSQPGTVVYDIGAATGAYAVALAKVASIAHVIAFEPLADSYATLVERTRAARTVRCVRIALGDEEARLALNRSAWRDTSSFLQVSEVTRSEFPLAARLDGLDEVRAARLDDVVREFELPPPDVVKIDVQGFEDRVIRGGEKTIQGARVCVVEVSLVPLYEGSPLLDDIYDSMRQLGFRLTRFGGALTDSSGDLLQVDAIFEAVVGRPSAC